ncbi:MAG: metallophosphoesterase, partial [Pseudomonadota bacterium]
MSGETVRIAVVADIHHGPDRGTQKGSDALHRLAQFKGFVAYEEPDAVVDLGDRVSAQDPVEDRAGEAEVAAVFARMEVPVHHICGNNDVRHLSVADNEALLGQSLAHEVADYGGWRLVLWRADARSRDGYFLPPSDIAWLAEVVEAADRPVAVMCHLPVSGHRLATNYHFESRPEAATYAEAQQVREVLAAARVPLVVVSGHVHWNSLTVLSGQPHITLQSLTETFTTAPVSAGAYGMLTLSEQLIGWRVFGEDPFAVELGTAATAHRWLKPE